MKYIADIIGEDYLQWKTGENILISTPTGSGKSSFILKKLLPHAIKQGKHILYLCNRKILKGQLESRAMAELDLIFRDDGGIPDDMRDSIHITTYQYCETKGQFKSFDAESDYVNYSREEIERMRIKRELPPKNTISESEILYYVFDEAHYFLSDSLFNENSNFWFPALFSKKAINVFLTATPDAFIAFMISGQPKFNLEKHIKQIYTLHQEKKRMREMLSKPRITYMVKQGSLPASTKINLTPQREINEHLRKINPYADIINALKVQEKDLPLHCYSTTSVVDIYENISTKYFSDLVQIIPLLKNATPENKWLVFVDREEDGNRLQGHLEEAGVSVEFLCAKSINRRGSAQNELNSIIENGKFSSSVLLSTRVMDCGVSIEDSFVKNIVIATHNKTTFLQMLGRVRLNIDANIVIYIKMYPPKAITGIRNEHEKNIYSLAKASLINVEDTISLTQPAEHHDGMVNRNVLSQYEINDVLKNFPKFVYMTPTNFHQLYKNAGNGITIKIGINRSAFIGLIFELAEYLDALEHYHDTGDTLFYLKRQLSWLNKIYAEENWLSYDDAHSQLIAYLASMEGTYIISKTDKNNFSRTCFELFNAFPLPPVVWKNDYSKFGKGERSPKLHSLNAALQEKRIPYEIHSTQKSIKGIRNTVWEVKEVK